MRANCVILALAPALLLGAQTHRPARRGHASRHIPVAPAFTADEINNPNQAPIKMGEKGSGVVRAEILLDRAYFSPGQIDGDFGSNLQKTVSAYQADMHLPVTGTVDEATWAALNHDRAPALTNYTVSPDDVRGPFVKLPPTMQEQAKLQYLGYASPLDELAERFHCSEAVLKALNRDSNIAQAAQLTVPNVITQPPPPAAKIVVSKSQSSVTAYDDSGKLIWYAVATIGSQHDPLPIGDWKIVGVGRNPVFHYDGKLFWNAPDKNEKEVIKPGPRNPVGVVWIDLSKEHYGIHGTPDPSLIGHAFSHGCIRLTNWDAWQLASMVKPGTPAILKE